SALGRRSDPLRAAGRALALGRFPARRPPHERAEGVAADNAPAPGNEKPGAAPADTGPRIAPGGAAGGGSLCFAEGDRPQTSVGKRGAALGGTGPPARRGQTQNRVCAKCGAGGAVASVLVRARATLVPAKRVLAKLKRDAKLTTCAA